MGSFIRFLKRVYYFFSPFAHPFERKVSKVLSTINESQSGNLVKKNVEFLMQENLAILNLWIEREYKGYFYLKKAVREHKYENLKKIEEKFKQFLKEFNLEILELNLPKNTNPKNKELQTLQQIFKNLEPILKNIGTEITVPEWQNKIAYMSLIMGFFKPEKYFHYQETTNFGSLLVDIETSPLRGDCNQIVTLYAYFYSLKFPISDLKIKLPHEHVCLHLFGIDIEATNASFTLYKDCRNLYQITELLAVNILDVHDFRENQLNLDEKTLLSSAQIAYHLSSNKDLVNKNLRTAYHNLALEKARNHNFQLAVEFMKKSGDFDALNNIYHNAVLHYLNQKDFKKALSFANQKKDKELIRYTEITEAEYLFKNNKIQQALKIFERYNETKAIKACYGVMFNDLLKTVKSVNSLKEAKKHRNTYKKMLEIAKILENNDQIQNLQKILNDI